MAGSRRRRLTTRASWIHQIRRSTRGAKLASSSSDGSPERPAKVVVVGGDAGGGGDGSPVSIPAFGGGCGIPRSIEKIGEGAASSVPIPSMCDGAGRPKEPVKLGAAGGEGSPGRVVNIGRSRLRVDHLGQFYVLDSEDEGTDTEAGLYVPDSEGEDGDCHGCGRGQVRRHASMPGGGDVACSYNRAHAVVASPGSKVAKEMSMVANPTMEVGTVADLAREVAKVADPPLASATIADLAAKVDVPVGAATADELHPEVAQRLKEILYWTWYYMQSVTGWMYCIDGGN